MLLRCIMRRRSAMLKTSSQYASKQIDDIKPDDVFMTNRAINKKRQNLSCVFILFRPTLIDCWTYRLFSYMYNSELGRVNDPYVTMVKVF